MRKGWLALNNKSKFLKKLIPSAVQVSSVSIYVRASGDYQCLHWIWPAKVWNWSARGILFSLPCISTCLFCSFWTSGDLNLMRSSCKRLMHRWNGWSVKFLAVMMAAGGCAGVLLCPTRPASKPSLKQFKSQFTHLAETDLGCSHYLQSGWWGTCLYVACHSK